jgi:ABC-2 type transport system permease protein
MNMQNPPQPGETRFYTPRPPRQRVSTTDLMRAVMELAVLVVCGLLVGWQWRNGLGDALLAMALILWLRLGFTWIGIYLGLLVRNPDLVGLIVFPAAFPLTALSNVFVAPELLPAGLRVIAEWNPLSATVAASRELFGNAPAGSGGSWAAENPVVLAVGWPLLMLAIFAPLAVRRYRSLSR